MSMQRFIRLEKQLKKIDTHKKIAETKRKQIQKAAQERGYIQMSKIDKDLAKSLFNPKKNK